MTDDETRWAATTPEPMERVRLPAFPVDALPPVIAGMVRAVAESTQTDQAMPATTALGVLAACAGGRLQVEVRPDWLEPVNLFTLTVAAPGERKSAVQAVMTMPLITAQRDLGAKVAGEIQQARTEKEIATKAVERLVRDAAKSDDKLAEAYSAARAAEEIVIPVVPRILADDVTPEAAASLLADQGGRLAIISAEGGIFDLIAGRYNNNVPNLDVWLKGHAGDRLMIDRKGRPSEYIEHPALTVSVMTQENVLRTVGSSPVMRGRGLLARFLYCLPASNVGNRTVRSIPMPAATTSAYSTTIRDLAVELAEWTDPARLLLSADALESLYLYAEATEIRLRPGEDLSPIADWANKLVGATARIAGLLHVGAHPLDGWRYPVAEPTMLSAIRISEFFTAHALAAFGVMGIDPIAALAGRILGVLRSRQVQRFTLRDLRRSWVQHQEKPDVTAALASLVEAGWILPAVADKNDGPGRRPSPAYLVHRRIRTP